MIFGLRRVHAFSLVEVTLALGVAAFCLLAVFGLMPIGVQTNRNATSQTAATNTMAAVVADIRATPKTTSTSAQYSINIPTDPTSPPEFVPPDFVPCSGDPPQTSNTSQIRYIDSQGQQVPPSTSPPRYRLIVTFVKNTTATSTTGATYAHLKVTWPAAIDPCAITPSGSAEMFAAFDRN
jgi:type II secretory pathway pseudopilin PulG